MARLEFCQLEFYDKYVARTMRCLPDKFTELCHSNLAFLLDLSGDNLELLLSGHEEHKKKKLGLPSVGIFKKKGKSQGLFGLPLTEDGVCLMMPLIQFLKMETNVTKEGLFRKTGNKSRMTTLRELLITHGSAVNIDPGIFSAHDVACVLKEFIRELPGPLLTERHLEVHMQILALGQHAKTPEELTGYSSRKLSAAQLLMLLLPSPVQILTMHLVKLLKRTADSPESKMTSATLGTIFAPIFFIDKTVQATDLLSQISKTAPAVSFIIDKADELFQPPKQLTMDLRKFWKSMKQSLLHTENRESGEMQKSPSGQTLYTDDENNLSRCDDDDAGNITAELTNLLEHMQKHKYKAKKYFDAPEFCAVLSRRSRSIGSSLRKRLPSLKGIRKRQGDSLRSGASSASRANSKTATTAEARLVGCPADTPVTRCSLQLLKPGQKRLYSSENCPTSVSTNADNTPVKQKCQETGICKTTGTDAANRKVPNNAGCAALFDSSADIPETRCSLQLPKPGQKRHYTSKNCPTDASSCSNNLPVKQTCRETGICKTTRTDTANGKNPSNNCCEALHTPSRYSTNVLSDFVENRNPRGLTSDYEDPTTSDIENKESMEDLTTCGIENKHSTRHISHFNRKSSPVNSCKRQKQSGSAFTGTTDSVLQPVSSNVHSDKPDCLQRETSHGCLQHYWPHRKITNNRQKKI